MTFIKSNKNFFIVMLIVLAGCSINNNDFIEHYENSKFHFEKDNFQIALLEIDSALVIDTSNLSAKILKAKIQSELSLKNEALTLLKSLLPKKVKTDTINYLIGNCYFGIASDYSSQKNNDEKEGEAYENAINHFGKTISMNPLYYKAYLQKAKALHNMNKYDEALITLNNAEKLFPDSVKIQFHKGVEKIFLGDNFDALNDINAVIQSNKFDSSELSDAYRFRGIIYEQKDSINLAIKDLTKAIDYDPKNKYAYIGRATLYRKLRLKQKACSDYRKAAELGHVSIYEEINEYCEN